MESLAGHEGEAAEPESVRLLARADYRSRLGPVRDQGARPTCLAVPWRSRIRTRSSFEGRG